MLLLLYPLSLFGDNSGYEAPVSGDLVLLGVLFAALCAGFLMTDASIRLLLLIAIDAGNRYCPAAATTACKYAIATA